MPFFDAHSHIHEKEFDEDRTNVLARMRASGVSTITVGTCLESSKKAVMLAESEPDVWASVGLHPTDTAEPFYENDYRKLALHDRVVAIGECGLDYFWQKKEKERKRHRENFGRQIELSLLVGKPLMIHSRPSRGSMDAYQDVLNILTSDFQSQTSNLRGNIHFFVGNKDIARRFLELGFSTSFTGVITFARDYDEVIKYIPLGSILSETDCPHIAPVPHRGKRNEPTFVAQVVETIAGIKDLPIDGVSETLYLNANKVFSLSS